MSDKPKRRWHQLSLKTLLVVMSCCGCNSRDGDSTEVGEPVASRFSGREKFEALCDYAAVTCMDNQANERQLSRKEVSDLRVLLLRMKVNTGEVGPMHYPDMAWRIDASKGTLEDMSIRICYPRVVISDTETYVPSTEDFLAICKIAGAANDDSSLSEDSELPTPSAPTPNPSKE